MQRWHNIVKRPFPLRHQTLTCLSLSAPFPAKEECFLFEQELSNGSTPSFSSRHSDGGCFLGLSNCFYPFSVLMLHRSKYYSDSLDILWPLLLLTVYTTDVSLTTSESHLFSGTSVMGQCCLQTVRRRLQTFSRTPYSDEPYVRLVISLVDYNSSLDCTDVVSNIKNFRPPVVGSILEVMLSVCATPSIAACIINTEFGKYSSDGIQSDFFRACLNGLLSSDLFFSSVHFKEMHEIVMNIIAHVGLSFDFLSVQWTSLLNKLSRTYMRLYKGEYLARVHFKLLEKIPPLEIKMPLPYFVRTLGSLVDAGMRMETENTSDIWKIIMNIASLAIRLHGNNEKSLQSIWKSFFKAAIKFEPISLNYKRVSEAYELCASLGHPLLLDKPAFSQVVRFLISTISGLSLDGTGSALRDFSRFLRDHTTINFLWVMDSLLGLLTEIWKTHGDTASFLVQDFIKYLQEDYFPSRRLSGIELCDNPKLRPLLENFNVVKTTEFWWLCGCGTQIPASSKKCLMCLRRHNASWTCTVCGVEHNDSNMEKVCICGSENPRKLQAIKAGFQLCDHCGDVLSLVSSSKECVRCGNNLNQEETKKTCSFCETLYSQRSICCPSCYTGNEEKRTLLWLCDECEEYNIWTWSKCQHCSGKRRVGGIVTPLEPWICGCGKRNHPCVTACEACSRDGCSYGKYAFKCIFCNTLSGNKSTTYLSLQSRKIRLIACQHCSHIHPRDLNVLSSPFVPRQCHQCGKKYIRANLPLKDYCSFCHAYLRYNELVPFKCNRCEVKSLQDGFHCVSCLTPRENLQMDDVYVWKCEREVPNLSMSSHVHVCGHWNYSWLSHCRVCGEGRTESKFECRVRFLSWKCNECCHPNLPIDVFFCSQCNTGIQVMQECFACGLPHMSMKCVPPTPLEQVKEEEDEDVL